MSRKINEGLEYFPIWEPKRFHKKYFEKDQQESFYRYCRLAGSGFIKKKVVRDFIFTRDNHTCKSCGSKENIQIDHVISVYRASIGELDMQKLNTKENLQTLCKKCNSAKLP
jgi:hypothetical protein